MEPDEPRAGQHEHETERTTTGDGVDIGVWDDEDGTHFAEGIHEADAFIAAVEAHIDECGVRSELARYGIRYLAADVEHGSFVMDPDDEERMHRVEDGQPGAFHVTFVRAHHG